MDDAILEILRGSECPYAARGRYVLGTHWNGPLPTGHHLDCLAHSLAGEAAKPQENAADAIVAVCSHAGEKMSLRRLSQTFLHCLAGLRERDRRCSENLVEEVLGSSPSWDFVFESVAYFIPVFSPIYTASHPRMSPVADTSFFLFQPESTFRRHGVSSGRPRRRALSEGVLSRFEASGKGYPIESVTDWPKAYRYIKPMNYHDGPVSWWLAGCE